MDYEKFYLDILSVEGELLNRISQGPPYNYKEVEALGAAYVLHEYAVSKRAEQQESKKQNTQA